MNLSHLLTTAQIAKNHRHSVQRVWALAEERGIKPTAMVGGTALWSPAAAKRLAPRAVGRPKKPKPPGHAVGADGR